MRSFIMSYAILFFTCNLFAQTVRMNNAEVGRTYTVEHQGQTNLRFLQEAERNYRNFQYEGTLFAIDNAVAQNPNSAEALILRARFKKRVGMTTEAEADLKMANRLNPYVANLYGYDGNSGLLSILSIEPEQSMNSLSTFQKLGYYFPILDEKRMLNENKEDEIVLLEKIVEEIENENLEEALATVNSVLVDYPNTAITYDLKGVILTKQGDYETAVESFSKAVALEPNFAIAWYNFGQVERKLGNLDKAKLYLDRAIDLQEDLTKAYFERAALAKSMGDSENALADYNKVIELKGNDYMEAFLNRGLTKKILGDYGGALSDLNRAIEEYPNNSELRNNRGNVHMLFGLHLKAMDDYTSAVQLNSDYAEAYFNRAMAHFLNYDRISGCYDLEKSAELGFEKAGEAQLYFCGE